jgi:hypothetical protein
MRQKAGPALPLHLPILYRKTNSNPSRYSPFARASALKGFTPARFREVFWQSRQVLAANSIPARAGEEHQNLPETAGGEACGCRDSEGKGFRNWR